MSDKEREALRVIADWALPWTGKYWDEEKTRPVSYESEYGSNGAREYMRAIARAALDAPEAEQARSTKTHKCQCNQWPHTNECGQEQPPSAQELSDEAIHLEWVLHRPMIRGGTRSGSIIEFARAILAAEENGLSASAMRMMWDDQSLEEKNHYLAAAKAQGGSHG